MDNEREGDGERERERKREREKEGFKKTNIKLMKYVQEETQAKIEKDRHTYPVMEW